MNGAKIQFSPEPAGGSGSTADRIYHNIKNAPPAWGLSPQEMDLVRDGGLILAKNRVIAGTVALFAALSEIMQEGIKGEIKGTLPGAETTEELRQLFDNAPKISRGENYKGFPWVVLDYPRCFGREDVFAVRTLFWWGHYFSVTLHLKGRYRSLFLPALRNHIPLLADAGFHLCISDDEWRHELATDNYTALSALPAIELDRILSGHRFLKFSATTPLENGTAAVETIFRLYDTVIHSIR